VFLLTFIGQQVGERWETWKDNLHYVDYAVLAAIVLGVIWLFVRRRRSSGGAPAADAPR
jgi:membrane protein DedA with SNARE-associated domain